MQNTPNLGLNLPELGEFFSRDHQNQNMNKIDDLAVLKGTTAPLTSAVGVVGQFYLDTETKALYQCMTVVGTTYTWEPVLPDNISKIGMIKDGTEYRPATRILPLFQYTATYTTQNSVCGGISPDYKKVVFCSSGTMYLITNTNPQLVKTATGANFVSIFVYDDFVIASTATTAYYYALTDTTITYLGNSGALYSNNGGNPFMSATCVRSWNDSTYVMFAIYEQSLFNIKVYKVNKTTLATTQVNSFSTGSYGLPRSCEVYDTSIIVGYFSKTYTGMSADSTGHVKRVYLSGTTVDLPLQAISGYESAFGSFTIQGNILYASCSRQTEFNGGYTYVWHIFNLDTNSFVSSNTNGSMLSYMFSFDGTMYVSSGNNTISTSGVTTIDSNITNLTSKVYVNGSSFYLESPIVSHIVLPNVGLLMSEMWIQKVYKGKPISFVGM